MAEGVLFNIAEGIIERLGSQTFQEIGLIWGVKNELVKLQEIVTQVKAVLLDAEQKQANNQVRVWLQSLEDVVYDADDVLDVFYCEAHRRQMVPGNNKISNQVCIFFSSSNQLAFRLKIGHKIKQIKERLNEIATRRNNLHLEDRLEEKQLITKGRETHSFVPMGKIIGRDEDKREVIQLLLDPISKENVSTISIVGFGGLGKTALAQLVFNDEVVQKHFELKLWTCVSDVFELSAILKKIIESATNEPPKNLGIDQLQKTLREKIDGKRYLLVLDDVWNQNREKWLVLKELLMGGAKDSRILITTRSKRVAEVSDTAKPYILKGLDEKQSWSLFKKMAFEEEKEPKNVTIKKIAEEIARKCSGVPLAIRTVGPMLYGQHAENDWFAFKNNQLSKIRPEENEILPTLKLSYDVLPSHLKHCFAYCSLFPPDYVIDVGSLVKLWMAQGFIKSSDENKCVEDVGYGYFKELLWRSFFQEETKDEFGMIISCKMHDLMNELAVSVSGTVSTIIDESRENFDEKYRHVSLNFVVDLEIWKIPSSLLKANKIRSFLFLHGSFYADKGLSSSFCNTICLNFKSLCMLSLNRLRLIRVPKCLSKMKQLRYLNLSGNFMTRFPNWVVKLENLQTLDLSYCGSLMELPKDLKTMINLRHLMLTGCFNLTHMPCGLGELVCLRTLDRFVLSRRQDKDSAWLGELKKLNELRGRLKIANLRHGKDVSKSNVANIMNEKRHLASLTLEWSSEGNEVNMDDEDMSLEALQPHSNLKELIVSSYGGLKFASWLSSLINIVNLEFYNLHRCEYIPPLDHLPCLKLLQLSELNSLEYISDDQGWVGSDASSSTLTLPFFPSLDKLILDGCRNLKGWWRPRRRDQQQSFPCLSTLEIWGCPRLTSMPLYPCLDKALKLTNSSFKPFQETMMMKMKNEDDNHMATTTSVSSSFSPLSKLKFLQIGTSDDKEIEGGVSEWIGKLTSLESLWIANSPNLASLPEAIGELSSLLRLKIRDCVKLTSLPEGIGNLSSLQLLSIISCGNLTSLPQGIGNLESLRLFEIGNCNNFTSFPEAIGNLKSLETFQIYFMPNLTSLPEGIGNLASLRELGVDGCENLTSLPEGMRRLTSLKTLRIEDCSSLLWKRCEKETGEDWPKIAHIPNLHIWPLIENDSEPEDNLGGGGKILFAFKTLMHCN